MVLHRSCIRGDVMYGETLDIISQCHAAPTTSLAVGRVRPDPSGDRLDALHIYRWIKERSSKQVAWMA
ncbi:hypothetical protein M747DRAFT_295970 [Aspergillus niger ATCC 13496]|uniref:Uncharacterized protein n=1 Tax=Aspergillus niger ATCC 13496 TaxID=1353008 RepID=A0A370BWT0_ASPNG|nr:hypothetical protein M747DRAFT_295970 [Aspergillus niger ATCC 13496]